MKINYFKYFALLLSITFLIGTSVQKTNAQLLSKNNDEDQNETIKSTHDADAEEGGPDQIKEFYRQLYYPYQNVTANRNLQLWQTINANFPSENQPVAAKVLSVNSWELLGPWGASQTSFAAYKYAGRINFIELNSTNNDDVKVVASSGHIWKYQPGTLTPECISNGLNTGRGGVILSDPTNSNIILAGTGDAGVSGGGIGLWKTIDGGLNWTNVPMSPTPSGFYNIMYDPLNTNIIHAATDAGYFRSDDGGATWTQHKSGNCTDVVVDFQNPLNVFIALWNNGMYKSTDGGNTFAVVSAAFTSNFGRTAMSMSHQNSNIIYANITNNSNNQTKGIYKTIDGGATWTLCTINPAGNIHSDQGWYDNVISVCPTNDNIVLAGGVGMWRTFNGNTFTSVDAKHSDQHAIRWNSNGQDVFVGNDGGVFRSGNQGFSFSNTAISYSYNNLPVTEYYHFSIAKSDARTVGGTAQDNGVHVKSSTNSYAWTVISGGDGSGITIDPLDANTIMFGTGVFGGALPSRRFISSDGGLSNTDINSGIDSCGDWFPEVRLDAAIGTYYTACERKAYYTDDLGQNWHRMNPTLFPSNVRDFTVSADFTGTPNIYMCMTSGTTRLMVYDRLTQTWVNRSAGLATNTYCRKVSTDINDPDIAYAVMGGIPGTGAGNKLYKTINRGQTWTNISGNIPNVSLTDLIANPYNANFLYVGSEIGGFKSTDGGVTWNRWNYGMPESVIINEMDYVDSTAINGKFYVGCCTYGRGIWLRDVSGDDPVGSGIVTVNGNNAMQLYQNTDNPGDNVTLINYNLNKNMPVQLEVFDLIGNKVADLANGLQTKGSHTVSFDRSNLKQGMYFYKLTSGNQSISKRMIVIRGH